MQAYEGMLARVKERAPQIRIEGVSIQKMIEDIDYELILGCKKHKDFGTVILFGMGGVTTELIRDFSVGLPPLNQTLARRLMEETKAYKLIQCWHGSPRPTSVNLRRPSSISPILSWIFPRSRRST
jgi:acetyltransferase